MTNTNQLDAEVENDPVAHPHYPMRAPGAAQLSFHLVEESDEEAQAEQPLNTKAA